MIGLRGAPALLIVDPATVAFSQPRLPETGNASSVAALADGTIGVGMEDNHTHHPDTVTIFSPSDRLTLARAESIQVSAWGDGFLTSGVGATSVRVDGSAAPVDLGGSQGNERLRPAELADGRVVLLSNDRGLLVLDPSTRRVAGTLALGTLECGLGDGSHTPGGPSTEATVHRRMECAAVPDHLTASGDDLVVDLGPKGIQRAAAATF